MLALLASVGARAGRRSRRRAVRLAAEHARGAGDTALWSRALGWYVATLIYGPAPRRLDRRRARAIDAQQPGPYLSACVDRAAPRSSGSPADSTRRAARSTAALDGFAALGMRT